MAGCGTDHAAFRDVNDVVALKIRDDALQKECENQLSSETLQNNMPSTRKDRGCRDVTEIFALNAGR